MDFSTSPSNDSLCLYELHVENLLGYTREFQSYCPHSVPATMTVYAKEQPLGDGFVVIRLLKKGNDVTARLWLKIEGTATHLFA